ncbi:hypothetical protein FGG08_001131 [Glutinoglossum americanum]|uniref:Uncharacterized protein n=1 Tax=Glutinoglossum americanum TaxID=1670608 RepID=A0A9P8I7N0_9PEZI|nr:hypothetical protein FGG08_001131 [Glutinoglossum americanum]
MSTTNYIKIGLWFVWYDYDQLHYGIARHTPGLTPPPDSPYVFISSIIRAAPDRPRPNTHSEMEDTDPGGGLEGARCEIEDTDPSNEPEDARSDIHNGTKGNHLDGVGVLR